MKKFFKFLLWLVCISAAISLGIIILWMIAVAFVVTYLFKSKDKYENISDFLKEKKNIVALLLTVILLVVIPTFYVNSLKEYNSEIEENRKQQAILDEQKLKEQEEKNKQNERSSALNAKSRFKKDIKNGKDVEDAGLLTEEVIERYNITYDEIKKYDKDLELAIASYEENELGKKYEGLAKDYVRENIESSVKRFKHTKSKYNEDKTKLIVTGSYTGKNQYGVDVLGSYEIEFDLNTDQVTNLILGKELVS